MGRLTEGIILSGCRPEFEHITWHELPPHLKRRYRPSKPLYVLTEPVRGTWDCYEFVVHPGAITDLSSIPRIFEWFGINRFTKKGEWDVAALAHDQICRGTARFPDTTDYGNIKLADQMYAGLGLSCGARRLDAWIRYKGLRVAGLRKYIDLGLDDNIMTLNYA